MGSMVGMPGSRCSCLVGDGSNRDQLVCKSHVNIAHSPGSGTTHLSVFLSIRIIPIPLSLSFCLKLCLSGTFDLGLLYPSRFQAPFIHLSHRSKRRNQSLQRTMRFARLESPDD